MALSRVNDAGRALYEERRAYKEAVLSKWRTLPAPPPLPLKPAHLIRRQLAVATLLPPPASLVASPNGPSAPRFVSFDVAAVPAIVSP